MHPGSGVGLWATSHQRRPDARGGFLARHGAPDVDRYSRRAAATLGNAAEILEAHPAAMQLRVLSTMAEVSAERNSTLIFPLPMEILRLVDTLRGVAQPPGGQSPAPAGGQG